jgi:hypothetical protein
MQNGSEERMRKKGPSLNSAKPQEAAPLSSKSNPRFTDSLMTLKGGQRLTKHSEPRSIMLRGSL